MRRHRYLGRLLSAYRENTDRHVRRYDQALSLTTVREREDALAVSTVELLNTWNNFSRAYWLSAFVSPKGTGGKRISCARPIISSDPIGFAVKHFSPRKQPKMNGTWDRRDEPKWHVPHTLLTLSTAAQLSCATDVGAAFSIESRVLLDLPTLRNYFGHRNQRTRRAAIDLAVPNGVPIPERPSELLVSVAVTSTQTLFYDWVGDLDLIADYLCA